MYAPVLLLLLVTFSGKQFWKNDGWNCGWKRSSKNLLGQYLTYLFSFRFNFGGIWEIQQERLNGKISRARKEFRNLSRRWQWKKIGVSRSSGWFEQNVSLWEQHRRWCYLHVIYEVNNLIWYTPTMILIYKWLTEDALPLKTFQSNSIMNFLYLDLILMV